MRSFFKNLKGRYKLGLSILLSFIIHVVYKIYLYYISLDADAQYQFSTKFFESSTKMLFMVWFFWEFIGWLFGPTTLNDKLLDSSELLAYRVPYGKPEDRTYHLLDNTPVMIFLRLVDLYL